MLSSENAEIGSESACESNCADMENYTGTLGVVLDIPDVKTTVE